MTVEHKQNTVTYHAGGKPGERPILVGADAKHTFNAIPRIDMAGMFSSDLTKRSRVADEVAKACREVGFFYAQDHQVPSEIIDQTFQALERWFAQDVETKMKVHAGNNPFVRGYEPLYYTKLDPKSKGDMKEAFMMGEDAHDLEQSPPPGLKSTQPHKNQWPEDPEFRKALYNYYAHVLGFSRQLIRIFALSLKLPEDYLDSMCTFPMTAIRALHYPPQPTIDGDDIGIGAHTDYSWFTLVCQDQVQALEVLNANGIWVQAPPVPGSFVVNIGDFLMQATNGEFQSTVHRVLNKSGAERYSMPFFVSPNEDAVVSVLPTCRRDGETYEEIMVGDYFHKRLMAARYQHAGNRD
ncbi:2OG-Fe(II)oxygenase superfamily protein [Phlyctema vagabunda]|uniref:2OG-Fe(II)oxygenase superfamily protein n=1 Tax=Phlyctema vagabunda TaxID=108571 RepID=A0ABR4PSM5_9HELO